MLSSKKVYWTTNKWFYGLVNWSSHEMVVKKERLLKRLCIISLLIKTTKFRQVVIN